MGGQLFASWGLRWITLWRRVHACVCVLVHICGVHVCVCTSVLCVSVCVCARSLLVLAALSFTWLSHSV